VTMERDERIRILKARGVELLRWSEDATSLPRAARLQVLSRPTRAAGWSNGRSR
jgi:hypothetical protein